MEGHDLIKECSDICESIESLVKLAISGNEMTGEEISADISKPENSESDTSQTDETEPEKKSPDRNPADIPAQLEILQQRWNSLFSNSDNAPELKALEERYLLAVQSLLLKNRHAAEIKNFTPAECDAERESIINNIETLLASISLEKAMQLFREYHKKWEVISASCSEQNTELESAYQKACDTFIQQRDWALWANFNKKEELCTALTELLGNEVTQAVMDRFAELRNEWKNTGPVPDRKRNEQWKKYRMLCKQLHEKSLDFYKEKEKAKEENLKIKETLCEEIEALIHPGNWAEATDFVIKIQKSWDALGQVPRESSDELWERFQKACRAFFEKRKLFFNDVRKKQQENFRKKRELCEKVEVLKISTAWKETSHEIKQIQKEWQMIGPVPRNRENKLWTQFRAACDYFFKAQQEHFDNLEKERPENLRKKEELCVSVEKMEGLSDNEQFNQIRHAQEEWKKIGPVPKEKEDELWQRFRKPIDAFFDKRKDSKDTEKKKLDENHELKEKLCIEAESLSKSSDWQKTKERLKELQKQWKETGPSDKSREQALWHRFHEACDTFFDRLKNHVEGSHQEKEKNLERKRDLCIQAEIISGIEISKEQEDERAEWQLKKLTENFWFKILDSDTWDDQAQKMIDLQKEWKEIGPVPPNVSDKIWKRFQAACNFFFDKRKKR